MTTVTVQAQKSCGSHGKECLKRKVLRRPRKKTQRGPATAQSPTVDSCVRWTVSDREEVDWRRLRVSKLAVNWTLSVRCDGAVPCRHLYKNSQLELLYCNSHFTNSNFQ